MKKTKKSSGQKSVTNAELTAGLDGMKSELMAYIDVKNEQLLHDIRGVIEDRSVQHDDRFENHERRILSLEGKVGTAA